MERVSASRVLLLSPRERSPRPDTDLTGVVTDLLASLRAQPGCVVLHQEISNLTELERAVRGARPDVVFNACETLDGMTAAEPFVPLMLDRLGVAFTGSTALCLSQCMQKSRANELLRAAGVPVPETFLLTDERGAAEIARSVYPVIVKPEHEDGSVGIHEGSVVHDGEAVARVVATSERPMIAQRYVEGREIAVALLGHPEPRLLSPGEILYDEAVFARRAKILTYASKWDEASADFSATRSEAAALSPALSARLTELTLRAARALGVRDYGRVDFRVDARGEPFVIDVNPNCDLSRDGGFMRAARRDGLSHEQTVGAILAGALTRARAPAAGQRAG